MNFEEKLRSLSLVEVKSNVTGLESLGNQQAVAGIAQSSLLANLDNQEPMLTMQLVL